MIKLFVLSALFLIAQSAEIQISWNEAGSTAVQRSISIGDTVTWITTDYSLHTISGTNNEILNSTYISANTTFADISQWSYTFNQEGSFDFQCRQHPNTMYGTVVVQRARTALDQSSVAGTNNGYYTIAGQADSQVTITLTINNPSNGGILGVYVGTNVPPPHTPDADFYVSCSGASGTATCRITISPCDVSVQNTYYVDVAPLEGSSASAAFSVSSTTVSSQFQVQANGTSCCNTMSYFAVSPTSQYPVVAIGITRVSGSFVNDAEADYTDSSWGMFITTNSQGCPSTDSAIQGQYVNFKKGQDTYYVMNLPAATTYYIGVTVPSSSGASFTIHAYSEKPSSAPTTSGAVTVVASIISTLAVMFAML